MIRDKFIRALLQGYKGLIMSYIWVNQQHNGANWSPKPVNMALFCRILSNNYGIVREARRRFLFRGGGTKGGGDKGPKGWD